MTEFERNTPERSSDVRTRFAETRIDMFSPVRAVAIVYAVEELKRNNLSDLSIVHEEDALKTHIYLKNNVPVPDRPETHADCGFGSIFVAVAIADAATQMHRSSSEVFLSEDAFRKNLSRSVNSQVRAFSQKKGLFHDFETFLEDDTDESAEILTNSLIGGGKSIITDLQRYPSIRNVMIDNHLDYPEFVRILLNSQDPVAHSSMVRVISNYVGTLKGEERSRMRINNLDMRYLNPLIGAATKLPSHRNNPYAKDDLIQVYDSMFGVGGKIKLERNKFAYTKGKVHDIKDKMIEVFMNYNDRDMREIAEQYFINENGSVESQILLLSSIGKAAKYEYKNNNLVKYINLAFEKRQDVLGNLLIYFNPNNMGVPSDFNRALEAMMDGGRRAFGKKRGITEEESFYILMKCLDLYMPILDRDREYLQNLMNLPSTPKSARFKIEKILNTEHESSLN